jgi:hypothetical protein
MVGVSLHQFAQQEDKPEGSKPNYPNFPGNFAWNARIISTSVMMQRYNGGERAVPLPMRKSSSAGLPVVRIGVTLGRFCLIAIIVPMTALTKDKMEIMIRPIFALRFDCSVFMYMFASSFLLLE